MMELFIKKHFKWLINGLLVLLLGVGGLLFLIVWLITLDERGVSPRSMYSWLLDGQLRRLPYIEGLVLQDHDLVASDGESVGFDRSNYRISQNDFDLSPWVDYWIKLGYLEISDIEDPICTYSAMSFQIREMEKSVCLKLNDRSICFEYDYNRVNENFKCPAPSLFGGETCVIGYPKSSPYSIYIEKKLRYKYVEICRDVENSLISISKSE